MFKIVIASFEIINKEKKCYVFEKTFLSAKFSINVILKILLLSLSNVKVNFLKLKFFYSTYISIKTI